MGGLGGREVAGSLRRVVRSRVVVIVSASFSLLRWGHGEVLYRVLPSKTFIEGLSCQSGEVVTSFGHLIERIASA